MQHQGDQNRGLTETELRTQFPSLPRRLSPHNAVTRSVHCECTLVMKIVDDLLRSPAQHSFVTLEIGVSKSLCGLCEVFMGCIGQRFPNLKIVVSTRHYKNVAGWRFPPSVPVEVSRAVEAHIHRSMTEIWARAVQNRRSGSEPRCFDSEFDQSVADVVGPQLQAYAPVSFSWNPSA